MHQLTEEILRKAAADYEQNGFAIIENYLSHDEVDRIKRETVAYVREETANSQLAEGRVRPGEIWANPDKNAWYFESGDAKTRLFFEPHAVDEKENKLKIEVEKALCKIGFALHKHRPFFMDFVRQKKIVDTLKALDYADPTLIQTMVNFKNPKVGGEFIPHQDTSYLSTTEPKHVVGFWFALDDATAENGCLDVIPGSHRWALCRKYQPCKEKRADGTLLEWTGPMAIYDEKSYIKVPCKKGALILIHGLLVHKSDPNRTDKSRWAFAFHAFDSARTKWVDAWLPSNCPAFVPIYAN